MTRRLAIAALLLVAAARSAIAGEVRITAPSYAAVTLQPGAVQPSSPDLDLTDAGGGVWRFGFRNDETYQAPLTVTVIKLPDGYEPYSQTFDLPYYWDRAALPRVVAAPVVNDNRALPGAAAFASSVHALPPDVTTIAVVNQRARRIFQARYAKIQAGEQVQKPDVSVAFWLLQSSDALVLQTGMRLDDTTLQAMTFLNEIAANPQRAARLMRSDTATPDQVNAVIARLRQRDAILYGKIVQQMAADIGQARAGNLATLCRRAVKIQDFFSNLPQDERDTYDSRTYANGLRAAENAALCKTRELRLKQQAAGLSDADRLAIQALATSAQSTVDAAKADSLWPTARANAQARVLELQAVAQ